MDCKIKTIEEGKEVFLVGWLDCYQFIEIRLMDLQYAKKQEWEGCMVKIQSPRSHKKQRSKRKIISIHEYFEKPITL